MKYAPILSTKACACFVFLAGSFLPVVPQEASGLTPEEIDRRFEEIAKGRGAWSLRPGNANASFLESLSADELRAWLGRFRRTTEGRMIPYRVAGRLGELEGKAAAEFIQKYPAADVRRTLGNALAGWARKDATGAFEWAVENGTSELVELVMTRGPGEQREAFLNHPAVAETRPRRQALIDLARDRARENPLEALAWWEKLSADDRAATTSHIVESLSFSQPAKAVEMAAGVQGTDRWRTMAIAIARWAESHPRAAMAWLEARDETELQQHSKRVVFATWVDLDVTGAWAWLRQRPPREIVRVLKVPTPIRLPGLDDYLSALPVYLVAKSGGLPNRRGEGPTDCRDARPVSARIERWGVAPLHSGVARSIDGAQIASLLVPRLEEDDIDELRQLITNANDDEFLVVVTRMAAIAASRSDPERAIVLAGSVNATDDSFLDTLYRRAVRADPVAALRIARRTSSEDKRWVRFVAAMWSREDPTGAREHFESLPKGSHREFLLSIHANTVLQQREWHDLDYMRQLVDTLPPGKDRNSAFLRLARVRLRAGSHEAVAKDLGTYLRANKVSRRETRNLVETLVNAWVKVDPKALALWGKPQPPSHRRYQALSAFRDRWDEFGVGEGNRRLEALGIDPASVMRSTFK